jgi:WD40 repeat protein
MEAAQDDPALRAERRDPPQILATRQWGIGQARHRDGGKMPTREGFIRHQNGVLAFLFTLSITAPCVLAEDQPKGWIGVNVQEITEDLASAFGLKEPRGALVAQVAEQSPAQRASLQRGDVIVALGGIPVQREEDFRARFLAAQVGTQLPLMILRNGQERTITVTVVTRPPEEIAGPRLEPPAPSGAGARAREYLPNVLDGVMVEALDERSRVRYQGGVVIMRLRTDRPPARAGLGPGDVIQEVGRRPIRTPQEYDTAARALGPLEPALLLINRQGSTFYAVVKAGDPPSSPRLRIESGVHTGRIERIGVDVESRYLVTGSLDKTVRVWDPTTGRLLQILRPPIGADEEGTILAVAISPDGRIVAAGGFTGLEWDNSVSLYLFDRLTGQLVRRIAGFPHLIFHLAFSKDGQSLAVTLGETEGLRIYRTSDWFLIGEDRDYGASTHWAEFDTAGWLATASSDGFIRLYDRNLKRVARKLASGGHEPASVSFSLDGNRLAVGYADSPRVSILSDRDLSDLYEPETRDVVEGNLMHVAWSLDGRTLYAGGQYHRGPDPPPIRVWSDGGRGRPVDLWAGMNTIMDLRPLKDGGLAFGAAGPSLGVLDAGGGRRLYHPQPTADYRNLEGGLPLSQDGSAVHFSYEAFGRAPARFNAATRALDPSPPAALPLTPALMSAPGLVITNLNTTGAALNGRPLLPSDLSYYEPVHAVAISPDHQSLLAGAEGGLLLFDRTGRILWHVQTHGVVWAVNIAGNGRMAVAAASDGTIRWFRLRDGQELLAFFPHADRRQWVLWTPGGYYDSAPGADDLIGWHVNRRKDQTADFFPVAQFRNTYYRPDIIAKVLETVDEAEAVRLANEEAGKKVPQTALVQMLPPVVTIRSPLDGAEVSTPEVTVTFTVRTPSGEPATGVKALVDGRPVVTQRGVTVTVDDPSVQHVIVPIPERDVEVSILAENRLAVSEPATVRLRWRGRSPTDEFVVKPKLYVLAVGVSQYANKSLTLGFAAKDAQDFAASLQTQQGGLYRDVTTKVLTDAQASKDEILDGLEWLQRQTTSKDVAMVFLAGHGVNDPAGIYYFLPVNADPQKLKRTGVAFSDIKNTIAALAGKTVTFIDTCHAGNIMGTRRGVADITAVVNELASAESGAVVFASSTGSQFSLEDPAWGNGAFTKALVEGLSGKADYGGKGKITINMLDLYLSERVKELTKGQQTPTTTKPQTVPDFPVALKQG